MMTQDRSSKHLFVDVVDHWPVEDIPGDLVHVVHLFSGTPIFCNQMLTKTIAKEVQATIF